MECTPFIWSSILLVKVERRTLWENNRNYSAILATNRNYSAILATNRNYSAILATL